MTGTYKVGDRVRVHDINGGVIEGVVTFLDHVQLEVTRDDGSTFTTMVSVAKVEPAGAPATTKEPPKTR